jgi:hypothetical protein
MKKSIQVMVTTGLALFGLSGEMSTYSYDAQHTFADKKYYIGADIGLGPYSFSSSQTPPDDGTYASAAKAKKFVSGSFYLGGVESINPRWSIHMGMKYAHQMPQDMRGDYYINNTPPADGHYTYQMSVQKLMAELLLFNQVSRRISLYGGGELGAAEIHTTALQFTMQPGSESGKPMSSATSKTSVAYGVTLGLDMQVMSLVHARVGVSKQWLGSQLITVNEGLGNQAINNGAVNPWFGYVGLSFVF